jgi:hypothetical protein
VKGDTKMILLLHVDDFIIADNNAEERKKVVELLNLKYGIKDLGVVERYKNYQVRRDREKRVIYIYQQDYIKELVTVLGMVDSTPSKSKGNLFSNLGACRDPYEIQEQCNGVNYRTATGALIHLACHSRPDIAFEVTTLCKYNSKPGQQHWKALKQLMRFLIYTIDDVLKLGGEKPVVEEIDGVVMNGPIRIKADNQGAIKYSKSLERSGRMKHIDVKFHWIREKIGDETVKIEFVSSSENVADIMTKTLGGKPLHIHRKSIGFERPEHLRISSEV